MHPNFKEFTVGDYVYRARKMDARTQFHVSRRILPVFVGLAKGDENRDPDEVPDMMTQFKGAAMALAKLPDDEVDYVLSKCLSVVQRKNAGDTGWSDVWNLGANRPMYDDLEMMQMLQIVGEVIAWNLGNFMDGLPSDMKGLMR